MWRELARRAMPWPQWTAEQKEAAHQDYQSALRRQNNDAERIRFWEEDNELFTLLYPYKNEMRNYYTKHTSTNMYGSASIVSPQRPPDTAFYEANHGEKITWKVDVHLLDDKWTPASGEVLFEIFTPSRQVDSQRVMLTKGHATYKTVVMPKGKYRVKATYKPLNTGNISSEDEAALEIV
jgi:hypothetical protein